MSVDPEAAALAILGAAVLLCLVRLVRGPSAADRVVAVDLIMVLIVGMIEIRAVATGNAALLDAGIVLALIAFLGTLAFARYLERQAKEDVE